jgi:hypothetical protein
MFPESLLPELLCSSLAAMESIEELVVDDDEDGEEEEEEEDSFVL